MASKKYYWLKLHRDFFKRHDVKIIEAQDNGKDYIIFYLKLLTECIDHEGQLRFSGELPYDEKMLAIITETNVDIVRSAVSAFTAMGLMERWDDGTYFMSKIDKMIGAETEWAARKRDYRRVEAIEKDNVLALSEPCPSDVRQEIETEKELDKDTYTSDFIEWWNSYPKKVGKGGAFKAWKRNKKHMPPLPDHIAIIHKMIKTDKWTQDGGQYIPNPMTWINESRWDDEGPDTPPQNKPQKKYAKCEKCGNMDVLTNGLCPKCRGEI